MFQQDNARAHTARATMDFLQQHNIRTMPWPALSPDLNPIEHLWDEVQRKLNEVRPTPMTAADLSVAFLRIWAAIPMAFINRLIHSMYRRCVSVVNAHGGHTRY
jgi:transposase